MPSGSHEFNWENLPILEFQNFFTKLRISAMLSVSGFNKMIDTKEFTSFLPLNYIGICAYFKNPTRYADKLFQNSK